MANHLHLLIKPDDASQLSRLMHWVGWYSAMALNRLAGRCGHFWEARYYCTAIAPKDHRRVLNTLSHIHANPKAAGIMRRFYDPIVTTGTVAGWRMMAPVNGTQVFCHCHQLSKTAPSVMSVPVSSIAFTPKEYPSVTGAQGC